LAIISDTNILIFWFLTRHVRIGGMTTLSNNIKEFLTAKKPKAINSVV